MCLNIVPGLTLVYGLEDNIIEINSDSFLCYAIKSCNCRSVLLNSNKILLPKYMFLLQ
jgi:hypothetical protein